MTDQPLKPCPFCGSSASVEEIDREIIGVGYSVGCDSQLEDACMGYQSLTQFSTRKAAIAAWNTRPDTAQQKNKSLQEIIDAWSEDAEWKPVQSLACLDDRMAFPVEAVLAGKDLKDCKDYILRDVVEEALCSQQKARDAVIEKAVNLFKRLGMNWMQDLEQIVFSIDGITFVRGDDYHDGVIKFREFLNDTLVFLEEADALKSLPTEGEK